MRRPSSGGLTPREIVMKTSATRDGRESFAPDLCPDIPPWPDEPAAAEAADDFPPVKSPLLMRARRVSLDSEASTPHTPSYRAAASTVLSKLAPSNSPSEAAAPIGAEEPEWLRQRREQRLIEEKRERSLREIDEHLQRGAHHRQLAAAHDGPPPAVLFGSPPEEKDVVYIWNLDSKLVSSDGLAQDLRQHAALPEVAEIRLPLRRRLDRATAERVVTGNRGYAYLEFHSPQDAEQALKVLQRVKINGIPLRAAISNPKAAIYEPRTLFLPSVPQLGDEQETERKIREVIETAWRSFSADESFRRKRARSVSDAQRRQRRRVGSDQEGVANESELSGCDRENVSGAEGSRCPWRVTGVRLRCDAEWRYAYVDLHCRSNVLEILAWQHHHRRGDNEAGALTTGSHAFAVDGEELIFAPSIPKKQRVHVTGQVTAPQPRIATLARTLHLSGMPRGMKEAKLRAVCEEHGTVTNLAFPTDAEGSTQGWALVEYATNVESAAAAQLLQGRKCGPKTIKVQPSTSVITSPSAPPAAKKPRPAEPEGPAQRVPQRLNLSTAVASSSAAPRVAPTSNDDFRQMLGL